MSDDARQVRTPFWREFAGGLLQGVYWPLLALVLLPHGVLLGATLGRVWDWLLGRIPSPMPHTLALQWGLNTLTVSGACGVTAVLIAVPVAWVLARTRSRCRGVLWGMILLMACTPLYVTSTAWIYMLGLKTLVPGFQPGAAERFLPRLDELPPLMSGGLIMGVAFSPFAVMLIAAGLRAVPRDVEEAGAIFTRPERVAGRITLPMAGWSVFAAGVFCALLAAGEITVTDALGLRTYAEQVYLSFHLDMSIPRAALAMLPLTLAGILGILLLAPFLRRLTARPLSRDRVTAEGRGRPGWTVPLMVAALVLYLGPPAHLAMYGLGTRTTETAPSTTVSTGPRGNLVSGREEVSRPWYQVLGMPGTTALVAAAAASLSVLLAIPWAWMLFRSSSPWIRYAAWAPVILIAATPGPLAGMAAIRAWTHPIWQTLVASGDGGAGLALGRWIYESPLALILLHASRCMPLSVLALWVSFQNVPKAGVEVARQLGADSGRVLMRVMLPLSVGGILTAWVVGYILSFGELGASVVLAPPGLPLFSVRFATLIHFAVYPDLARLMLLPFLMALLPAGLAGWILRRYD